MSLFGKIENFFYRIAVNVHFFFHSYFYATINAQASIEQLRSTYFGLGPNKWKECIDAKYHHLGKDVFALGLHGGCIEPGYVPSMEAAHEFCARYLNKKVDADWYLQLHQITCRHFDGDERVYLMTQDRVGVFRDSDDYVGWYPSGTYAVTPEAKAELKALHEEVWRDLGPDYGMGGFETDASTGVVYHRYHRMTREQIRDVFTKFLNEFYTEVEQAPNPDKKLEAIAKLNKRLELLHPVKDGSGRTNTAFINKILTEYGFHPVLLDNPYFSTSYGLKRWTDYFKAGLQKWEAQRVS